MEEMTIWEQYTVTINKDPRVGFGIAVSGGREKAVGPDGNSSIIISDVVRGGPADGRLQTRDCIVMVNGVSMENVASTFAIQSLKACGKTANLTVKRPRKVQIPITSKRQVEDRTLSDSSYRSEDSYHYNDASDEDEDYNPRGRTSYPPSREHDGTDGLKRHPKEKEESGGYDRDSPSERSYNSRYNQGRGANGTYERRSRADSYERRSNADSYARSNRSYSPDAQGHSLPLSSGFKRLPKQEDPFKPIKTALVKTKENEEYGLKLGSQIFVKHITDTGLAAKDGTLQEGDIILKINGIVTENLSLGDTKRLIEKSKGKLSLLVLRDNQHILVNTPELEDSDGNESSGLEDISDLESEHSQPLPSKGYGRKKREVRDSSSVQGKPNGNLVSATVPEVNLETVPESKVTTRTMPEPRANLEAVPEPKITTRIVPEPKVPFGTKFASMPVYDESDPTGDIIPTVHQKVVNARRQAEEYNSGYSPDTKVVKFIKESSIGLRLAGGNDVGIFVSGVNEEGPAAKQGIKEGDQILKVNGVGFHQLTREEAVLFLLDIPKGEDVLIQAQTKQDIYKKMLQSNVGDSFHIRTHFDYEADGPRSLGFTRGEVFRVMDTMYKGSLGSWLAARIGPDFREVVKGVIPNKSRAEQIANVEMAQRSSAASSSSSGPRAEFWKMRGLRGAKKNLRKSRDDLTALTVQNQYPPYERVVLREANFKRPVVILGPITDIAIQMLDSEMHDQFEQAQTIPRDVGTSVVIKLNTVRRITETDKHALLDITPSAIERLNYMHFYPIVIFCDPDSKQGVKVMRQRLVPHSNKSCRRLYAQAVKMRKYCTHLFSGTVKLNSENDSWYRKIRDLIKEHQSRPIWFSEDRSVSSTEENLEMSGQSRGSMSDYLSCDSRANSDYEDTDGEGGAYTDNELDEPFDEPALARSSEPVRAEEDDYPIVQPHRSGEAQLPSFYKSHAQGVSAAPQRQEQDQSVRSHQHESPRWKPPPRRNTYSSDEERDNHYDDDDDWGPATEL
ncbi:tight junction protein ZO-3 isoform X2 [Latimeria chalumnae]